MASSTLLLVEDSTPFRRSACEVLRAHGYRVLEAADGGAALALVAREAPALLLLDTTLPDFAAADLVAKVRALPAGAELPVIGLLGIFARPDDALLSGAGFDDFLVKPLDGPQLVESVATHLAWAGGERGRPGRGKRLLLADDDADYLAVARIRFQLTGFEVETAADGREALEKARAAAPDVIASDVLMPRLDGLGLCAAVRADPALARVPVVLFSGNYLEKADRKLARDAGCTFFVARTGDLKELAEKVLEAAGVEAPSEAPAPRDLEEERRRRSLQQLERQTAQALSASRRNRLLQAQVSVLAAVAEALGSTTDADRALREAFVAGFDAWALCPAALFTLSAEGAPVFRARSGYAAEAEPALEGFLGHPEIAARVLAGRTEVLLRPTGDRRAPEDDFLEAAGARMALLLPLVARGEASGVLLLASPREDLEAPEVRDFARAVAGQIAEAVALSRTVARLRASEERYRCLVENANDAFFLVDPSGEVLEANRRAEELLARPVSEIRRHRLRDFAAPDAPDTGWEDLERLPEEGSLRVEAVHFARPDGTAVPAEVSASRVRAGSRDLVLVIARDITRRRALERRLFQAQKMEAVGQLAGGIAHDFNNLLMVINGYSEILLGRTPEGRPGRREIEEVLKAGQKAAALTSQLLGFSRRQISRPRVLDLPAAVAELEEDLRKLAGPGAEVAFRHEVGVPPVKIDPGQLEQVLVQLVLNAREALPEGRGRISVEIATVLLDEAFARENDGARPGPAVAITVSDEGRGMDEATLARAFEPFFTTKEPGKGSGLGLATVYGIVKQNDGYVRVESRPGEGTRVRIYLPRVEAVVPPPSKLRGPADRDREKDETVLVVEDEWAVRSLVRHVLGEAGYAVLEASSGQEAIEVAERFRDRIDLLLTDVVMPGLGGRETARRLREARPGLKVLFMSGYSYDALLGETGEEPFDAEFLSKPFPPDILLEKVETLLRPSKAV
jgi:PAS domain S-box-containing protein